MLKVAVIFEGSPFDRKGLFNAVHNRVLNLLATGECSVDVFCILSWDTDFTRRMRRTPFVAERCPSVSLDGIEYRMLWYDFSLVDFALVEKLKMKPLFFAREVRRWLPLFEGYDCLAAHSFTGGLVAQAASDFYGTPYFVTWHGSDVHTHPMGNSLKFRDTASVMRGAECNFFVSEALMRASEKIVAGVGSGVGSGSGVSSVAGSDVGTGTAAGSSSGVGFDVGGGADAGKCRKEVLYNGVGEGFERFPEHCRAEVRLNNGLSEDDKVVAFVGSIVAVKNVSVLQPLFHEIRARYDGPLKFWMVGDGKLRGTVEPAMVADSTLDVTFWGDVPSEHMPSVMNCIDVLVLPSLNEGLPLVCAEAIRCGASVVGSDVGGIPEVIGQDFVVPLGPDFVSSFAEKVVYALTSPVRQSIPDALDWASAAQKELSFLRGVSNSLE